MLTAVVLLLHAGAGTVVVADVRGHRGQQRIARGNQPECAVPHQLLHFTGPGVPVRLEVTGVCRDLVEGDGAVVEVQCGWGRDVRATAVLVEIRRAVAENGLLFDGPSHQF